MESGREAVSVGGPSTFRDFDVAVARDGDELDVRVLGSPAGETTTRRVTLPDVVRAWPGGVGDAGRADPRDAGPADGTAVAEGSDEGAEREVGPALFATLFHGDALTRYRESRRRVAALSAGLRVVLRFSEGADAWPWELLWDPEHRRFLALDENVAIVRCTEMPARDGAPAIVGPLRVLVAISTPPGTGVLDAAAEERLVREQLAPVLAGGALELDVIRDASLDGIRRRLQDDDVHVFHYIGHGAVLPDAGSVLVLTGPDGQASTRRADELAALLGPVRTLRLAVLNSCHGSPADDDPFAGAAPALVKAGVPAVVAMRRAIGDRAAIAFAAELYGQLVAGARIETAVTRGRAALFSSDGPTSREWSTIALHLGSSLDADLTVSPVPALDDDVQFTVSRPTELRASEWEHMLVFAHRSQPYERPDGGTVDPKQEVEQRIAGFFGAARDRVTTQTDDAARAVPRGAQLVVVPDLPDVECEPERAPLVWTGEISELRFLLRASSHRVGSTVTGAVRIFCGPLVIAETRIEARVVASGGAAPAPREQAPVQRYQRIFPCFSPEDADLVVGVAAVAEALGDRYLADVIDTRRSGAPDEWLLPKIAEADVFQLFWSSHSMSSPSCRRQWETALTVPKDEFIRPLYWEDPFPRADGLPPDDLGRLRFVRVPGPTPTTTETLWTGTPTPRPAPAPEAPTLAPRPPPPVAPAPAPPPTATPAPQPTPVWDIDEPRAASPGSAPAVGPQAPPPPRRKGRTSWWAVPAMAAVIAIAAAGVAVSSLGQSEDDASPVPETSAPAPPTTASDVPTTPVIAPTTPAPTQPSTTRDVPRDDDSDSNRAVTVIAGIVAVAAAVVAVVSLRRRR